MTDCGLMLHADAGLAFLRPLGLDKDNAVGTTRTVDGRCRSILQYLDRSDVCWIDLRQIACLAERESVHYDKRGIRTVKGTVSADTYDGTGARILRGVEHLKAGSPSLKKSFDGIAAPVLQRIHLHGSDGTGQVTLLHAAVADHDNIFEHLTVNLQLDIIIHDVLFHSHFSCLVAETFHTKDRAVRCRNDKMSVGIGNCTGLCPL